MPTDPLPQYAGLFAEWPEIAPRDESFADLVGVLTLHYVKGERKDYWEWRGPTGRGFSTLGRQAEALALCRSAAIMELSKRGYGLVPAFSYNQTEGAWGLHDHEGCTRYVDGPTFDAACMQALRAVRGEGK
jgi:hypothetical protein